MRGLLLMLGLTCGAGNAFAGGPLWVVPNGSGVTPAKWKSPVQVYTDVGAVSLGCDRNPETYECIPDSSGSTSYPLITQQQGETLVKQTLAQWTDVPTSSFGAQWAGRLPEDITSAVDDPVAVWHQFCAEALIVHTGSLQSPPPSQLELGL